MTSHAFHACAHWTRRCSGPDAQTKSGQSGAIFIWDRIAGRHRGTLEMLRDRVVDVAWHPLQNVVVCVSGTTGQVWTRGFLIANSLHNHLTPCQDVGCWVYRVYACKRVDYNSQEQCVGRVLRRRHDGPPPRSCHFMWDEQRCSHGGR